MNILNKFRNVLNIRTTRKLPPKGPKPQVGSNIVFEKLRIRLKHPITDEQWQWFTKLGWRAINMRANRRSYICVPDKILIELIEADKVQRDVLHQQLVKMAEGANASPVAADTQGAAREALE